MKSATRWQAARFHVLAIVLLYALTIPVAHLDQRDLRGSGGGWISLDLRGLYVGAYLIGAGLVVAALLLHLSVKKLRKKFSFGLVLGSLFAPACLVPAGSALYRAYLHAAEDRRVQKIATTANLLADNIQLRWSASKGSLPTRFELELTSRIPVEVLHLAVSGSAASRQGLFIDSSAGDAPLAFRLRPGVPQRVLFTLDHEPTPDTYFSVYSRLAANGIEVSVGWVDPSEPPDGCDTVRRIPLH